MELRKQFYEHNRINKSMDFSINSKRTCNACTSIVTKKTRLPVQWRNWISRDMHSWEWDNHHPRKLVDHAQWLSNVEKVVWVAGFAKPTLPFRISQIHTRIAA